MSDESSRRVTRLLGTTRDADPLELQFEAMWMLAIALVWMAVAQLSAVVLGRSTADALMVYGTFAVILFFMARMLYQTKGWRQ